MAIKWFLLLSLIVNILLIVDVTSSNAQNSRKAYIVFMGDIPNNGVSITLDLHVNILREVVDASMDNAISHEDLLLHRFTRNFHGFAAMLTYQEAEKLAGVEGVVSVFPNEEMSTVTTKSWDLLEFPVAVQRMPLKTDVIVGVFDSGLWPESESFTDTGFGPPPKRWNGTCDGSGNFTCNNKIIGARYYLASQDLQGEAESPRDLNGHGTHTASIVAGNIVNNASLLGLGLGTARGGVPSARVAVYKICWGGGSCDGINTLRAFDDAINDNVDIISGSVGGSSDDYFRNAAAIGSYYANKKGILVSMSAGNEGPKRKTLKNFAPWQLSVAATTTNRQFITKIELGNGKIYEGLWPNIHDQRGKFYPLVYGGDKPNKTAAPDVGMLSRFCAKDSLDVDSIKDTIVLCDETPEQGPIASQGALLGGAAGVIFTGKKLLDEIGPHFRVPLVQVGLEENSNIYKYINQMRNPTASIWRSEEINDVLAPYVPSYSSRGPNPISANLLKPDLAAPGSNILAAFKGVHSPDFSGYDIMSGTSMACPHASAVAAYVKSFHPEWSPAAIRSALMTTAKPMSDKTSPLAEFAYGAGLLNPSKACEPGLVYDLNEQDYVDFLCSQGYNASLLHSITSDNSTACSPKSINETINDFNYPSFTLSIKDPKVVNGVFHRTVTNVGSANSTYKAQVVAPLGLKIKVNPDVLSFTSLGQKISFVVTVEGPIEKSNMVSASLVWDDDTFKVRSPIVVYVVV